MKRCPSCSELKPLSEYWTRRNRNLPAAYCKTCSVAKLRQWRKDNPEYEQKRRDRPGQKDRRRHHHLNRKYGSSLEAYEKLRGEQGGRCAICGAPEAEQQYSVLHVDHCHTCQSVRGLLCGMCNRMLGSAKDDPERLRRAVDYLARCQC